MSRLLLAAIGFVAIAASCGADKSVTGPIDDDPSDPTDTTTTPTVRTIPVTIGGNVIQAELATTLAERQTGLMGRAVLPDTAGMLFVFSVSQLLSFWMYETPVDLDIAFLDSTKTILNIDEMTANTTVTHQSNGLARYALEMRRGWFSSHGITAGTKLTFTVPSGLTIDP